ncbi:proline--tRNA ligase [Kiritimatiella glycovorans]|uniref:Proline--tRNA ligase n=1 Tax=Kiritimatiella glycovorans TaxID=1307763 RepID=A0A0G3EHG3_9BACT|nr:proline--tRNA ligase [Kiritimatiella glycovorans]AKJ64280.1 Proline--tRNA ligase [Kiritimatiella glycovorans]
MAENRRKTAITPTREDDYAEWYQQVVRQGDLAETSPVRGCMVIRPWGYALWENIRDRLDAMFKETGHRNAYFPLFIPKSYLEKEAEHVEGFAKECAVVTHHRLEASPEGGLQPAGELEEPLVVRPTSETIIGATYARWVQSYRDLPILINQWANVVRWELRTRLFLRTAEFLWQEGHTVHETEAEAWEETVRMLNVYQTFAESFMAMPVIAGEKTAGERFPGAVRTLCIESMMQDRKALQAGTSHFLGQNFARSSGITYQSREGREEFAWTTSWGVSTRLIGGLIMTHADDDGMVMPPRLAPAHAVLLPIIRRDSDRERIMAYVHKVAAALRQERFDGAPVRVEIDDREVNAGEKGWEWVRRGVPLRVEIGPRDMEKDAVFVARRDRGPKEKTSLPWKQFVQNVGSELEDIQSSLFERALDRRERHTREVDTFSQLESFFTPVDGARPGIHGGFARAHWCGREECEKRINDELSVTIRSVPLEEEGFTEPGKCICCGNESRTRVVMAKSY